ncbi:MAG: CHASE3 domain-containing protein [Pirellulaceae bacterium]
MNSTLSRGAWIGFAMVFATLVVNAAVTYLNVRRLHRHNQQVERTHQVLAELQTLLTAILDAESGMRGYLITHEPSHVEPYDLAIRDVRQSLKKVAALTLDNPAQQTQIANLRNQVQWRLNLMQTNLDTHETAGFDAARARILTDEGKQAMGSLRKTIRKMQREEQRLLANREAESATSYWTAIVAGLISTALGLALAAGGCLLVRRDIVVREQASRDLQQVNDRLEERVRERTAAISDANATLRDEIDERRRAEEQVRAFAEELRRSNRELEQFASVASHDLQEPLRKIQAFGDRLAGQFRQELGEKGQDYLDRILGSASRMRALIDDLLAYSRVATKAQPFAQISLSEIAAEVISDLEARTLQSGGRIELGGLPAIHADPLQMRQLLQNLIGNGLKFHRPGVPPVVRVYARMVQAPLAAEENSPLGLQCELTVEDNGIGFETVYSDRIFELFQRLHGRNEYEGTGIGLAICKKIVDRHKGTITAYSSPGQGARFVVTLPIEPQEREPS